MNAFPVSLSYTGSEQESYVIYRPIYRIIEYLLGLYCTDFDVHVNTTYLTHGNSVDM